MYPGTSRIQTLCQLWEAGIRVMLPVWILTVSFNSEEGDRKEGVAVKVTVIKVAECKDTLLAINSNYVQSMYY